MNDVDTLRRRLPLLFADLAVASRGVQRRLDGAADLAELRGSAELAAWRAKVAEASAFVAAAEKVLPAPAPARVPLWPREAIRG